MMLIESEHNLPFNRWFKYVHGHRQLPEQKLHLPMAKLDWNNALEQLATHFDSLGFDEQFTPDAVADILRRLKARGTDSDPS